MGILLRQRMLAFPMGVPWMMKRGTGVINFFRRFFSLFWVMHVYRLFRLWHSCLNSLGFIALSLVHTLWWVLTYVESCF